VVGQRDGWASTLGRPPTELVYPTGPIQQRVFTVYVEMDELLTHRRMHDLDYGRKNY
jgi:hypothetical protein